MQVTRFMLETFRAAKNEIKVLQEQLDSLAEEEKEHQQTDTVKGSSPEYPYLPTVFKVSGLGIEDSAAVERIKAKRQKTKAKLLEKKMLIEEQREAVETWLDGIADPNIRSIIRLHYIEGYSYERICVFLGTEGDGSTQRKQINKFWQSQK